MKSKQKFDLIHSHAYLHEQPVQKLGAVHLNRCPSSGGIGRGGTAQFELAHQLESTQSPASACSAAVSPAPQSSYLHAIRVCVPGVSLRSPLHLPPQTCRLSGRLDRRMQHPLWRCGGGSARRHGLVSMLICSLSVSSPVSIFRSIDNASRPVVSTGFSHFWLYNSIRQHLI